MGSSTTPYSQATWPSQILDQKSAKKALTMAMLTCKLHLIVIVAPWKLYSEKANRGRGIQISGHRRHPIYRSGRGHVTYFWNFGTPSISRERLERETSNFACRFITRGTNERNGKLGQRGSGWGHVTYFWNFWIPSICREWLELETSNLVCRFITRGINEKMKIVLKGSRRGYVTYFWNFGTPSYLWERSSNNTAVDRAILSKFGFKRDLNIVKRVLLL